MKRTKPEIQSSVKKASDVADRSVYSGEKPIVKPIDDAREGEPFMKLLSSKMIIGVYIALILLGVGTGYLLSRSGVSSMGSASGTVNTGKVVGSTDTKTFKDSAEGEIQKGDTDGEGTHQLIRDGGPSQTVTLISSVVDLDEYVGKKVKVSGQTLAAKHAAWLMDVGKVEQQ